MEQIETKRGNKRPQRAPKKGKKGPKMLKSGCLGERDPRGGPYGGEVVVLLGREGYL